MNISWTVDVCRSICKSLRNRNVDQSKTSYSLLFALSKPLILVVNHWSTKKLYCSLCTTSWLHYTGVNGTLSKTQRRKKILFSCYSCNSSLEQLITTINRLKKHLIHYFYENKFHFYHLRFLKMFRLHPVLHRCFRQSLLSASFQIHSLLSQQETSKYT